MRSGVGGRGAATTSAMNTVIPAEVQAYTTLRRLSRRPVSVSTPRRVSASARTIEGSAATACSRPGSAISTGTEVGSSTGRAGSAWASPARARLIHAKATLQRFTLALGRDDREKQRVVAGSQRSGPGAFEHASLPRQEQHGRQREEADRRAGLHDDGGGERAEVRVRGIQERGAHAQRRRAAGPLHRDALDAAELDAPPGRR